MNEVHGHDAADRLFGDPMEYEEGVAPWNQRVALKTLEDQSRYGYKSEIHQPLAPANTSAAGWIF